MCHIVLTPLRRSIRAAIPTDHPQRQHLTHASRVITRLQHGQHEPQSERHGTFPSRARALFLRGEAGSTGFPASEKCGAMQACSCFTGTAFRKFRLASSSSFAFISCNVDSHHRPHHQQMSSSTLLRGQQRKRWSCWDSNPGSQNLLTRAQSVVPIKIWNASTTTSHDLIVGAPGEAWGVERERSIVED